MNETESRGGTDRRAIGRRRLLGSGLALAAGATFVEGIDDYVDDEFGTITYAFARPDGAPERGALEPRTREVSPRWHASVELALSARDRIVEAALDPIIDAAVVPGEYGEATASLDVTATEAVGEALEELVAPVAAGSGADLAVDVSVIDELSPRVELADGGGTPAGYQLRELSPEGIPGGVLCVTEVGSGTLSPAVIDADSGERFFATSNHVYGSGGAREHSHHGAEFGVLHGDQVYRIGSVGEGYPGADLVRVEPEGWYRPASRIERADPAQVIGQYTRVGLADLAARGEPLTKVGALSGRSSGPIHGVGAVTCYAGEVCKRGQLKWGGAEDLADGDSGSVSFHEDPENPDALLVAGINNARTWWPGGDFTWGTAAHHLRSEYGLHF
ncbi:MULTISPECIES: hypothetical protein [Saliphagus]|uniref:Uncharacterized protein n=1 Tax=Saliphagus infecundisoli TaxID=1849069 RepID=A0ABD5QKJ6_9EURY|nr:MULTISPECIES: hypothetical protein [Saliphagus]